MNEKQKAFKKKYGFDPTDIWSLDAWLARELSKRIYAWLEVGVMSHPADMTPEEWDSQLRAAADGLRAYCDEDYYDEESAQSGVKAMQWITDNFIHLWD